MQGTWVHPHVAINLGQWLSPKFAVRVAQIVEDWGRGFPRRAVYDQYLEMEENEWEKRFPNEFYEQIYRLRGWSWMGMHVNRYQIVGHYTNDMIWDRLVPGLRDELDNLNPIQPDGERRVKHHQFLVERVGVPKLVNHLVGVLALMRASQDWHEFTELIALSYPKPYGQFPLRYPRRP